MTLREKEWILQRNDLAAIASNGFELSTISGFIETLLCRLSGRLLLVRKLTSLKLECRDST